MQARSLAFLYARRAVILALAPLAAQGFNGIWERLGGLMQVESLVINSTALLGALALDADHQEDRGLRGLREL